MITAWAMLVVSSDQQAETLPDQRAWAVRTCAEKGWSLDPDGVFEDVASGKRGVRKTLIRAIAALTALPPERRPTWFLMIRVDRATRGNIAEGQIELHKIVNLEVRIWTRDRGEVKLTTAMDQLVNAAVLAAGAVENEIRTEKALEYYGKRRAAGAPSVTNKRPYGLRVVKGGQLEAIPGEAEIVQRIFEMRIAGAGATTIGRSIRTIAPMPLRKDGTPRKTPPRWRPYQIARMLRNTKYRGTIVDEVTWLRAQAPPPHLVGRVWDMTPKYPWPLTGALRCWCGGPMFGEPGGHPPKKIRYYRCNRRERHPDARKGYRADLLESQFFALLKRLEADPDLVPEQRPRTSVAMLDRTLRAARAELTAIDKQRDGVWELHAQGHVRAEDVQERLDALAALRNEIAERVSSLEAERTLAASSKLDRRSGAEIIAKAVDVWDDPAVTALDQRAVAIGLSTYVGGLYVTPEGDLKIGSPAAQRTAKVARQG